MDEQVAVANLRPSLNNQYVFRTESEEEADARGLGDDSREETPICDETSDDESSDDESSNDESSDDESSDGASSEGKDSENDYVQVPRGTTRRARVVQSSEDSDPGMEMDVDEKEEQFVHDSESDDGNIGAWYNDDADSNDEDDFNLMQIDQDSEARGQQAASDATKYALKYPGTKTAYRAALKEDFATWMRASKIMGVEFAHMQEPGQFDRNRTPPEEERRTVSQFRLLRPPGLRYLRDVLHPLRTRNSMAQADEMGYGK